MADNDKSGAPPTWAAVLVALAGSAGIFSAAALLIHVPLLLAQGASTWPGADASTSSLYASVVFLAFTALVGCIGIVLVRTAKGRVLGLSIVVLVTFAGLCGVLTVLAAEHWSALYGTIAWFCASVLLGAVLRPTWNAFSRALGAKDGYVIVACVLTTVVLLVLVCFAGTAFSIGMRPSLPTYIGGYRPRTVQFVTEKDVGLRRDGQNRTETVWLLHEDGERYWLKHLSGDKSTYVVRAISKEALGDPLEVGTTPEQPTARAKRWDMTVPRLKEFIPE
jgi:hypothetical protein